MIIALYGKSSSGKTTIACALRQRLGNCPVRHCGEIVKARAKELRVDFRALSDKEHRAIDADTQRWVEEQIGVAIVEGRYLHHVLRQVRGEVQVLKIDCNDAIREERWAARMGRTLGPNELSDMDSGDEQFVTRIYGGLPLALPVLEVDTGASNLEECIQEIVACLGR